MTEAQENAQRAMGRIRASFDQYEDGLITEGETLRYMFNEIMPFIDFGCNMDGQLTANIPEEQFK